METFFKKITCCATIILISSFGFYYFIKSAIVSSTELAALNHAEGLTPAECIKQHGNDPFFHESNPMLFPGGPLN